jgi:hypothetical protein
MEQLIKENADLRLLLKQSNSCIIAYEDFDCCCNDYEPHEKSCIPSCPCSPDKDGVCSAECCEINTRKMYASYVAWFEKHRWTTFIDGQHTLYCDVIQTLADAWRKETKKAGHL